MNASATVDISRNVRARSVRELVRDSLRASLSVSLPDASSEHESLEAVLGELAPVFELARPVDDERRGALLLVSDDAGAATAVRFWSDALSVGLGFASPGAFPWCLANAPCAAIARRFCVTGPNHTWLAPLANTRTAFDAPAAWLADRLLSEPSEEQPAEAWLVAMHFGAPVARAMVWYWRAVDPRIESVDPFALTVAIRDIVAEDWSLQPQAEPAVTRQACNLLRDDSRCR